MTKIPTINISVEESDNINWVLKKFKRQCDTYGIIREYRKRIAYRKPSVRLKEKLEAAEKRRIKDLKRSRRNSRY